MELTQRYICDYLLFSFLIAYFSITNWMDMSLSKFQELVVNRES